MSPGGENIGGMNVSIDADYSPLAAAYSTAQSMSQTAGTDIANALADGAAAGADVGQQIADSLTPITPAADDAAAALGGMGDAASGAGDDAGAAAAPVAQLGAAAETAGGSIAQMSEQLLAMGEALAITEGLREFGSEALTAADSITHASIALTAITGSGDTAKTTIEGLEALGMQDGLSMPSLLTAATRMQQLLGPGTDVVSLLGTVANGAAVMGTDIEQAGRMFDTMAANGTVMARGLGQVGLTMQGLADAANQVNPQLNATATSLTTVFKTMDQADRVTALQIAFQGLGGVAQQVAEQTFGGQWQQLANAWEQVMVQVGQALLPVISDLLDFTKTDIVPWLESAVAAFNELPGPVKDLAVGLAIATAALVPITGALAAVGLAVTGLQGLLPAVTALFGAMGVTAGTVATEETAQAVATAAVGAASVAAVPEVEALAVAQEQLSLSFAATEGAVGLVGEQLSLDLVPAMAAADTGLMAFTTDVGAAGLGLMALGPIAGLAVLSAASLKDGWNESNLTFDNVVGTLQNIPEPMTATTTAGKLLATASDDLKTAWSAVLSVFENYNTYSLAAKGINDIANGVQVLSGSTSTLHTMMPLLSGDLDKLQSAGTTSAAATAALALSIKQAAQAAGNGEPTLNAHAAVLNLIKTQTDAAAAAYKSASIEYGMLTASFASGQPMINGVVASAAMVAMGLGDLNKAASDLGVTIGPLPGSMDAITAASNALSLQTGILVNQDEMAQVKTEVVTDSLIDAENAYTASAIKVQALASEVDDWTKAQDGSAGAAQQLSLAQGNLVTAYDASAKAYTTLTAAATDYTAAAQASIVPQAAQLVALDNLTNALGPVASAFTGVTGDIDTLRASMPNFGVIMTSLSSGPLAGLQSALAEASAKVDTLAAKMATGANVGQQYEQALTKQLAAQIALDQEQAVAATGLQGVTDATSLATVAVAAAQAKYNDMVTAYQAGLATYAQMQAATSGLKSAQDALNTAQGSGISLADQLGAADGQVATAANTATGALNAQAAAATAAASAMGSLSAADAAAAAASANASTTSGMLADNPGGIASIGVGSAPSGYVLQSGSLAGHESVNAVLAPGYTTDYAGSGATGTWFWSTFLPTAVTFAQALQLNVAAAEKAAAAQYSGTDPFSLDEATLASAQADLQTLTKSYEAGNQAGVTAAQIQSAQTAVATAQAAVNALSGTSASTSTSTASGGVDQSPIIVSGSVPLPGTTTTGTTATSTTGTTGTTATTSVGSTTGGGTSANDGGSYPAVTAHQSSSEVWNVAMGTATSGTAASSAAVTAAASSTDAATASQAASTAASSAVNATAYVASSMTTTALALAASIAALDSTTGTAGYGNAVGAPINPPASTTGLGASSTTGTAGYGNAPGGLVGGSVTQSAQIAQLEEQGKIDAAEIQAIQQGLSTGNIPQAVLNSIISQLIAGTLTQRALDQILDSIVGGALGYVVAPPPGGYPATPSPTYPGAVSPGSVAPSMAGGGMNVHIDFTGANFSGASPSTVSNAVQAGMTQALVQTLRASGARF